MIKPTRITPDGQDLGLLYFTTNSIMDDDKKIVLIGKKNGVRNMYCMNVDGSGLTKLTDIPDDTPAASIYNLFSPPVYSGGMELENIFGEPTMDCHSGNIYYLRGRKIMKTNLKGESIVLGMLPVGSICAVLHVSDSGRKLLVATTDAHAFDLCDNQKYTTVIDDVVQSRGLSSVLRVYDTATGDQIVRENVPRAWITHVQFHPENDNLILYNHEWPTDCGVRRMWMFDGYRHIMVRTEGDGRSREDWTCHEMWARSGRDFIYHGTYRDGISYLGRALIRRIDDVLPLELTEIPFPKEYVSYGHFTMGNGTDVFTDGYFRYPQDPDNASKYICKLEPDWENRTIKWIPLCEHNSTWSEQDSHPHPVLNHKGDILYFNSDYEGHRAVYSVKLS